MRNPVGFASVSVTYLVFQLLAILVAFGIFIILLFIASIAGIAVAGIPLVVISVISFLVFSYFTGGFYASLINSYNQVMVGNKVKFLDFYKFAMERASTLFGIIIIKMAVTGIFTAPILALYLFVLKDQQLPLVQPYMLQIVELVTLFMVFLAHFIFFAAPIHAATSRTGVFASIGAGFKTIRQKHISAFVLYAFHSLIWLTFLVPLLDILTLLILYPIMLSALITATLNTKTMPTTKSGRRK